jgi:hypothetical protein
MKMKEISAGFIIAFICLGSVSYGQKNTESHLKYSAGFVTGYNRGFGFQPNITVSDFAPGFPFELRLGIGYTSLNPGNAADARRIFINNATNGTPEKKGRSFDFRFDFMLSKSVFGITPSYMFFGPRYSTFNGNFKYIGGNEIFDVTSQQWGIGVGFEHQFKMAEKLSLSIVYGIDYYMPSTLSGHDTSYSPDNDNVNPENDNQNDNISFKYKDANKAISQPQFMPRILIGLNFNL